MITKCSVGLPTANVQASIRVTYVCICATKSRAALGPHYTESNKCIYLPILHRRYRYCDTKPLHHPLHPLQQPPPPPPPPLHFLPYNSFNIHVILLTTSLHPLHRPSITIKLGSHMPMNWQRFFSYSSA